MANGLGKRNIFVADWRIRFNNFNMMINESFMAIFLMEK